MVEKEIKKPSLTQRRKITGSQNLSSEKPAEPKITKPKTTKTIVEDSEDISIVKVVMVVAAVIVVAVIAAFLIQATQGGDDSSDDTVAEDTQPTPFPTQVPDEEDTTPTPTTDPEVTPTPTVEETPTPTVTTVPDSQNNDTPPAGEILTNDFGQDTQFLSTSNTGVRIRTYLYRNTPDYYEFALPIQDDQISDAKAFYDSSDNLVLEVQNVSSFVSCGFLNDNSTAVAFGNVNSASCVKNGTTVTFTFDVTAKNDFRLTTGAKDVNGEEVQSVLLNIK